MRIARILSIIFHPLWMSLLIWFSLRVCNPEILLPPAADYLILMLLLLCAIAPAVSIYIMLRHGLLSNIELSDRRERTAPYLLVVFYYCLSLVLLKWKAPWLPEQVAALFYGVISTLVAGVLINQRWKISVHMLAQGGWFGVLLATGLNVASPVLPWLILASLVAGLVGYARLKLKAHTPAQVYAGFGTGLAICAAWMLLAR